MRIFVSGFGADGSGGVGAYVLNTRSGRLEHVGQADGIGNAFHLALATDGRTLYVTSARPFGAGEGEEVVAFRILPGGGLVEMNRRPTLGSGCCYVACLPLGRALLAANYFSGDIVVMSLESDGAIGAVATRVQYRGASVHPTRQCGAHPHAIVSSPCGRHVYVADLGLDRIHCLHVEASPAVLCPGDPPFAASPPGAGPRHIAFTPTGSTAYVINELNSTVSVYGRDPTSGRLTEEQLVSTLPAGFGGDNLCADIQVAHGGRFVYGTNRGHDSIALFESGADGRLEPRGFTPSAGAGPQSLALTPDGEYALCANMGGNSISCFHADPSSGRLQICGDPIPVSAPTCIKTLA